MHGVSSRVETLGQTLVADQRSWRRRLPLRISLRALLIFVLMVGGLLGWVVHLAHVQRDAVMAIKSGGGQVTYDWQLKRLPGGNTQFDPRGRSQAPEWLIDYLGHDYFGHVEYVTLGQRNTDAVMKQVGRLEKLRMINVQTGIDVTLVARAGLESLPNAGLSRFRSLWGLMTADVSGPQIDGANFKYLKNLTRLEILNLPGNCSVTDADLLYLTRLTSLRHLELNDPRITDAGLSALKDMTRLKFLRLSGTQVTGAGLSSLRAMHGLQSLHLARTRVDDLSAIGHLTLLTTLDLAHTPIDDKGLAPMEGLLALDELRLNSSRVTSACYASLKHLSKLNGLSLRDTRVGDEGSAALAELKALMRLDLDGTRITDNALAHLAGMSKMNSLSLTGTAITDRGLLLLTECKALRRLNVRGTKVSREGVKAFKAACPHVNLVR
jgi:Leucine Rich repeat